MNGQHNTADGSKATSTAQVTRFLLLLGSILLLSTLASLMVDLRGIGEKYRTLAGELGRSFFHAIDVMRDWNLEHGGVYVVEAKNAPPNPYLPESMRTVVTKDGRTLNMINHAEMTRLFSELLTQERGVHIHITSLTPIRPQNYPDNWEKQSLADFRKGTKEVFGIVGEGDASVFRYMAPLQVEATCLSCHSVEKDSPDHIRGGISVSFSYVPFRNAIASERRQNVIVHLMFFTIGIALIVAVGRKLIENVGKLQDALLHVKRLEGFLPICAHCKKIRLKGSDHKDPASWIAIEKYIEDRTDAEFTHGLCPHCAKTLYPNYFQG